MMFGTLRLKLSPILWVLLGYVLSPALCRAESAHSKLEPQTIERLLEGLKAQGSRPIRYQELRMIPALKTPIQFMGFLEFLPPDTLIKTVERPVPSTYVLSSSEIKVKNETTGEEHSLKPESIPELAYIRSGLTSLLSGDKATLLAQWRVALGGTNREWKLNLIPDNRERSGLRWVEFKGRNGLLKTIQIEALDGSKSTLSLGAP